MKVKAAAFKLDLKTEQVWIQNELNGYLVPFKDYPKYRQIHGQAKAYNPYNGWIPLLFDNKNPEYEKIMSLAYIGQNISTIEETVKSDRSGSDLTVTMDSNRKNYLWKSMDIRLDIEIHVSRGQISSILDAVKGLVLDWSLVLEREGIIGEGMTFSRDEKEKAADATTQIFAQNVGTVGNISGQANVSNMQISIEAPIDRESIRSLINQISDNADQLPPASKSDILEYSRSIDLENENDTSIKNKLNFIKAICEGITGSLIASGILASVKMILG